MTRLAAIKHKAANRHRAREARLTSSSVVCAPTAAVTGTSATERDAMTSLAVAGQRDSGRKRKRALAEDDPCPERHQTCLPHRPRRGGRIFRLSVRSHCALDCYSDGVISPVLLQFTNKEHRTKGIFKAAEVRFIAVLQGGRRPRDRGPVEGAGPLTNTVTAPSCRSANASHKLSALVSAQL
jgi:hypothetical protein